MEDTGMKIEITQDEESVLLNRRNLTLKIAPEDAVCSRDNVKNMLVALLDTKPELLILDRMNVQYGTRDVIGYARLYNDLQDVREIEADHMIARNAIPKSVNESNGD